MHVATRKSLYPTCNRAWRRNRVHGGITRGVLRESDDLTLRVERVRQSAFNCQPHTARSPGKARDGPRTATHDAFTLAFSRLNAQISRSLISVPSRRFRISSPHFARPVHTAPSSLLRRNTMPANLGFDAARAAIASYFAHLCSPLLPELIPLEDPIWRTHSSYSGATHWTFEAAEGEPVRDYERLEVSSARVCTRAAAHSGGSECALTCCIHAGHIHAGHLSTLETRFSGQKWRC